MIPLFFLVVCVEGLMAFLLMVKIGPIRELVMKCLDQVKIRRATVLTIGGTVFVILLSNLFSILNIQNKGTKHGTMTPMEQVLWRTNLLEATLMGTILVLINGVPFQNLYKGFTLFLGFLIDRMHHYLRKLVILRSNTGFSKEEVEKLENEKLLLKEKEEKSVSEVKKLQKEVYSLTDNLKKLKLEFERKQKQMETAEGHVASLHKQAADLLLEYDRLLEDNQNLQNQTIGDRN